VARGFSVSILRIAEPVGMRFLQVLGYGLAGFASHVLTGPAEAIEYFDRAVATARDTDLPAPVSAYDPDLLTVVLTDRATALVHAGRISEGLEEIETARRRAETLDHEASLATARSLAAVVYYTVDEPERARRCVDEALALLEGRSLHAQESFALVCRGWARAAEGDPRGMDDADRGVDRAESAGTVGARGMLYLLAAHTAALCGRFERAWELIGTARKETGGGDEVAVGCIVDLAEAEILRVQGRPEEAARAYRIALESSAQYGVLVNELRAATALARLAPKHADTAEARELLAAVLARFSGSADTKPLIEARAALAELGAATA
jgi:tetratricopeptide (TPR) repeat protein